MTLYGLYYYSENQVVSLPLLGVRVEASIKELAAQVKLTQTYRNDASRPIEARYSFPIPVRASVCSFVMIKQDGTQVIGVVKEKQDAKKTYDAAVAQGQQASLMEMDHQSPDVFKVSVGNIPPNEQVHIELVYATELSEDEENDSIRFHLPVHIGARYGQRFTHFGSTPARAAFLTILLNLEAAAPIAKISSPSHTVSTELGPDPNLPNFKELPFSNYARISLSSDSALDKDFVLAVKSAGLDAPRCVAELHPTHDTVALALTLVPRFKLPDVSRQEFVFMVDRSGSMSGRRIEAAKKAMVVMLRALPHEDSLFQIVSFGSHATSLWPQGSKPYNQDTLEEATRHVDAIRADYGGTEIRAALQHCFDARKGDRPMSLLVLTDGDAWDVEGVLEEVKSAVAAAPAEAYLRVSVLGIGNSASTAMCEGMARVGNGTCMMVEEEETSFTGKIARILKAAKTPPVSNIQVDWGPEAVEHAVEPKEDNDDEFELVEDTSEKKKTLNIYDEGVDPMQIDTKPAPPAPTVVLSAPAEVQQAPFHIKHIFPAIRLNLYAILQGKTLPKTVTIRGTTIDGAQIELPVPVLISQLQNTPGASPVVHALAARKLIQDLEDGKHALAATLPNSDDADLLTRTVKASIVRLGTTYSIVSAHTSFVAVDESKAELPMVYVAVADGEFAQSRTMSGGLSRGPAASFAMARFVPLLSGAPSSEGGLMASRSAPAMAPALAPAEVALDPQLLTLYSAELMQAQAVPLADEESDDDMGFGLFDDGPVGAAPVANMFKFGSSAAAAATVKSTDPLEALARLQSFDGRFGLEILSVIKLKSDIQAVRNVLPAGASDEVVATLLAMAFLANKLGAGAERDSWEAIYEKAQRYVKGALQGFATEEGVDVLETKVTELLA